MAKTLTIQQDEFSRGLELLTDDSKARFGSARRMLNVIITDRGGISPRPGTTLLGEYNASTSAIRGLYNFRKSKSQPDILIKSFDEYMEYFHPTLKEWAVLEYGYTPDKEFDFTYSLVNTDNDDFTYFCNAYEEYSRWNGSYAIITAAVTPADTEIQVDSLLNDQIYLAETATANSATTVTLTGANWATDMWKNLFVYFPGTGKVRLITGNTIDTLTFTTLGAGPGNVTFQIRQLKFPLTDTVIYEGAKLPYTTIDVYNRLPVSSPHAAPINTPLALVGEVISEAPRGNRIDVLRGRVYVGHVRSAVSRDLAGDLQGSTQAGSVFVSQLLDPADFSFAATRIAGEGDILNVAYGGGDITDVQAFEDQVAFYKNDYIELVKYTEDVNDTALRTPLKTGIGSLGRVIKGSDDHYFMRPDKVYTSLGRVRQKDIKPETENLGYVVKRLLDDYNNDNFTGIEFNNRILSAHKSSDDVDENDVILVYNKKTRSFEGIWSIGANNFDTFKEVGETAAELVYGESNGANIWKMFQPQNSDVRGDDVLPYTALWQSNFFNVLPIKSNMQSINSIAIEGYISANTTYTYSLYTDFNVDASLSFTFSGTEVDFVQGSTGIARFFGSHPFGTMPIAGTIGNPDENGRRRFSFIVYFPWIHCQYLSSKFSSSGKNQDWEIIRCSYGLREDVSVRTSNTKVIS